MDTETPAQITSDTQPEFDTSAAIAEISSDLFRQGEGSEESQTEGEQAGTPAEPSAAVESPPTEGENSEAVQAVGAPSTWTKEALEEWAAIPPRAQQEILKREDDMYRGLEQYKTAADLGNQYDAVAAPYKSILEAEGLNPVEMFQGFAANHYILSRGTPEQKIELAASMLSHYGIALDQVIDHMGDQILNPIDPRTQRLEQEVQELRLQVSGQAAKSTEAQQQAAFAEIEAFAKDPAHPYFNELVDDIAKFMSTGVAQTLAEAYEKAVYANPVTRQKELDRLTADAKSKLEAEGKARKDKLAKTQAADVKANSHQRDGTVPIGSMDDTLNATLAAINSRG